jgi:hypothetical protein
LRLFSSIHSLLSAGWAFLATISIANFYNYILNQILNICG